MYKIGDFIVIKSINGHQEAFRISSVNGVYYNDYRKCYTILYNDGSIVALYLSESDVELLIGLLY